MEWIMELSVTYTILCPVLTTFPGLQSLPHEIPYSSSTLILAAFWLVQYQPVKEGVGLFESPDINGWGYTGNSLVAVETPCDGIADTTLQVNHDSTSNEYTKHVTPWLPIATRSSSQLRTDALNTALEQSNKIHEFNEIRNTEI